jgi:hypothetical protein
LRSLLVALLVALLAAAVPLPAGAFFWAFESGAVQPLALSSDGSRLNAVK